MSHCHQTVINFFSVTYAMFCYRKCLFDASPNQSHSWPGPEETNSFESFATSHPCPLSPEDSSDKCAHIAAACSLQTWLPPQKVYIAYCMTAPRAEGELQTPSGKSNWWKSLESSFQEEHILAAIWLTYKVLV